MKVDLYDRDSIEQLKWPNGECGEKARKFLVPLVKDGVSVYLDNLNTNLQVLNVGDLIFPITVNEAEYQNSYLCSPYTQYVHCAREKVGSFLKPLVGILGGLKLAKINRVVMVNNWLLTTNLYPEIGVEHVKSIVSFLKRKFPKHAIVFRSVDEERCALFKESGAILMPSRPTYHLDSSAKEPFKCRPFAKDRKLFEKTDYQISDVKDGERIAVLYRALYVDKYSKYSPQYTGRFFSLLIKSGLLQVKGLSREGSLDAVCGFYENEREMTSPLFGYDTEKPRELGLYRLLNVVQILEAKKRRVTLNMSAGAGKFKKQRKAKPQMEYLAVFSEHLPLYQRGMWRALGLALGKAKNLMFKLDG